MWQAGFIIKTHFAKFSMSSKSSVFVHIQRVFNKKSKWCLWKQNEVFLGTLKYKRTIFSRRRREKNLYATEECNLARTEDIISYISVRINDIITIISPLLYRAWIFAQHCGVVSMTFFVHCLDHLYKLLQTGNKYNKTAVSSFLYSNKTDYSNRVWNKIIFIFSNGIIIKIMGGWLAMHYVHFESSD